VSEAEDEAAARLLERLLSDPAYRAAFRADPVQSSRAAGVESVAREMATARGKVFQTLDDRESRSSLAGVLMAAALEGAALVDFSKQVLPQLEEVPRAVGDVLSGLDLPGVEDAQAATPRAAAVPPVAGEYPVVSAASARSGNGIDPSQFGETGGGGPPAPGTAELLANSRISLDSDGIADLKAGRIDPRIVAVLQAVSRDHTITESAMMSDHDKFTSSGYVSNHYSGRAVDIAVVDGQPVGPGNAAARKLAEALSRLPASIRPTEIGSPWALPGAAYFTDGAHQNHIHIAFDDPIAPGWQAPGGLGGVAPPASGEQVAEELPAVDVPASEIPAVDTGDEDAAEPGGLEDPGGDTDAEADAESDGGDGGDEDNDSVADDPSDEQEEGDEADEGDDGGVDGDHDDSSDLGSDDSSDSDGSDGGEDDGSDGGDDADGGDADSGGDVGGGATPLDLGDAAGAYPGDDAPQAQLAAWMGAAAQKRGLPPELPVMASLVESHLKNLDGGDADSVGFFQMRLSVWNNGDYAGYPDNAALQLKWFLEQAEAVKKQRIAAGKSVTDPSSYGDWIADIERPAAQYRYRYQLQLGEARELLQQSGRPRGGGAEPQVELVANAAGSGPGPRAEAAVREAQKYLDTPYQWGGSTPQTGFDCSGLMQWAYAKAGIHIPRTSEMQILAGNATPVARKDLQPGDLVFFRDSSGDVHHVGMSLGGDRFLHAPHTGDVVKISSLKESYYAEQYTGARRFDTSGGGQARAAVAAVDGGGGAQAPPIDAAAVKAAEEALLRDAAEAQRPGTLLFEAVRAQEVRKMAELARRS
jgi:cell wall-associated NlpC family hydrolase